MRKRSLTFKRLALAAATLLSVCGCASLREATPGAPSSGVASQPAAPAVTSPAPAASAAMPAVSAAKPSTARIGARWDMSARDKTLKAALERWSQTAGWRLFWELGVDYRLDAPMSVDGSFEDAVSAVVRSMDQADVPPKAIFYRGNHVLRMVARGME